MARARNLVLIGFMGSGKTAVGRRVAERLGLAFVDLDDVVVQAAGRSIVAIFRDSGEPEFRRLEREALARVAAGSGQVIAPGGGAVMDDGSWRRLNRGNLVVRLQASPRALLRRLREREEVRDGKGRRPRDIRPLADVSPDARRWPAPARRRVVGLMAQREDRYSEAPHAVDTTGRPLADVVAEVAAVARAAGLGASGSHG